MSGTLEFNERGEVTYYRLGELVSSGLSKGHIGFTDTHEFYLASGSVWKAFITSPLNDAGYRSGARFESELVPFRYFVSIFPWERGPFLPEEVTA